MSVKNQMSGLDFGQVIREVYDDETDSLQVKAMAGTLVTEKFDNIEIQYESPGKASVVIYKLGETTVATVTLTYDGDDITSVVKTV